MMIFRLGELFYGTGVLAHGKARRRMVGFVMRNACANRGNTKSAFAAEVKVSKHGNANLFELA